MYQLLALPKGLPSIDALTIHLNDRLRTISSVLGQGATGPAGAPGPPGSGAGSTVPTLAISRLGNGVQNIAGQLSVLTSVTSGLTFESDGSIVVNNGSGIAIDPSTGKVTVNPGVGLQLVGGLLEPALGTGLGIAAGSIVIPGGAITDSLIQSGGLLAVSVNLPSLGAAIILAGTVIAGTANIQNGAITTALIANLAVGNAQIANCDASKITTGTLVVPMALAFSTFTLTLIGSSLTISDSSTAFQALVSPATISCTISSANAYLAARPLGHCAVGVVSGTVKFEASDTALTCNTPATFSSSLGCGNFGANGATPVGIYTTSGAVSATGATNVAPYGFTTSTQANAIVALLNQILTALTAAGIAT